MTEAVGPIFAAGFQHVSDSGHEILYLPDLHNEELQAEGKAPVYWWLPNSVRLARKNGDTGDYKFSMIHFVGVRSEGTTVGQEGTDEVSGGLLGFSTTSAPPGEVLKNSEEELLDRFRGNDDKYWGWRTSVAPQFRPAPIVSNHTTVTNLSPNPDGSLPVPGPSGGAAPSPGGGEAPSPAGPPGGPPTKSLGAARMFNPNQPPAVLSRMKDMNHRGRPPQILTSGRPPIYVSPKRPVPLARGYRDSNLDMWYANLQGQGSGSVSPFAENAYGGLLGSMPAALVWASFHGGTSAISVWQLMKIKVWSPVIHLMLKGDWSKIQSHYSGAAHAGGWFWSADVKAEFNNLRISGAIEAKVEVDTTLPNADKLQEQLEKRSDLLFEKFMAQAQKTIFEPAPFTEKPAEASGGFLGWGGGAAFKVRRDTVNLQLSYEETREMAYLQEYPVSGQLEGLHDEIKADPAAEKKYFTTLYLEDWDRKITRVVKPVVNWPDPEQKWEGQPVAFMSVQVGYPNVDGVLQWDGHMFQPADGADAVWNTAMARKALEDVKNPPPGWAPDKTFIKRSVHFTEAPGATSNPFVRTAIEKNVVELDPGEFGRAVSDINLEVRADDVGALSVGPVMLNVDLTDAKQIIEVTFQALGKTDEGNERPPVKFSWEFDNQTEPRFWMVFTGQPDFLPKYKYQVRVIVKGTIFSKGMEWIGPWEEAAGNGPLMVRVPMQDEEGVVTRSRPPTFTKTPHDSGPPPQVLSKREAFPPKKTTKKTKKPGASTTEVAGWTASSPRTKAGPPPKVTTKKSENQAEAEDEVTFTRFAVRASDR